MSSRTVSVEVLLMAACSMVANKRLMGAGICTCTHRQPSPCYGPEYRLVNDNFVFRKDVNI